jgi:RHS repeat-associated protein
MIDKITYTFLTNYSDTQVSFACHYVDNLTIHHKQGVLRQQMDYYPYGLTWGRQLPIDPATAYNETYNSSEFNYNEWGDTGLDLNYFEARYYDPVLGRFHAPDPYQQFHSPYMANFDDPANHIDPDGRASKFQQFLNSDLGMICQTLVVQTILGGALSGTATGSNIAQAAQALATLGGTISTVSSLRGGGMAQLTQSATVQDAAAQPQPNPKPISTETPQAAPNSPGTLEPVAVEDAPEGSVERMQMQGQNQATQKPKLTMHLEEVKSPYDKKYILWKASFTYTDEIGKEVAVHPVSEENLYFGMPRQDFKRKGNQISADKEYKLKYKRMESNSENWNKDVFKFDVSKGEAHHKQFFHPAKGLSMSSGCFISSLYPSEGENPAMNFNPDYIDGQELPHGTNWELWTDGIVTTDSKFKHTNDQSRKNLENIHNLYKQYLTKSNNSMDFILKIKN